MSDLGFDPSLKKKKKTKKPEDSSVTATESPAPSSDVDDMFAGLKKKKKSKKAADESEANEKTDSPVPDDLSASLGDLTLKKKKNRLYNLNFLLYKFTVVFR